MFDPRSLPGTTVSGKYVWAERLGSGSFGWVFVPRTGSSSSMAPEVCQGTVGPEVDVWALGPILQQCVTTTLPCVAQTDMEPMAKLLSEEPVNAAGLPRASTPRCGVARSRNGATLGVRRGCLRCWRARCPRQPLWMWPSAPPYAAARRAVASPETHAAMPAPVPASKSPRSARSPALLACNGPPESMPGVLDAERWVLVPAGDFRMGSPADDEDACDEERPQLQVSITRPYFLKVTPVTQAEWREVMGTAPSRFKGDALPVEQVSWLDAVAFCNELSVRAGIEPAYVVHGRDVTWHGLAHPGFRLPTEAEWEHACRAGTSAPRYGQLEKAGWYSGNSGGQTRPVRGREHNEWGVHDMLGNVWEWCWDRWSENHQGAGAVDPTGPEIGASRRVNRGGSWGSVPRCVRAAYRSRSSPGARNVSLGFRPARSRP